MENLLDSSQKERTENSFSHCQTCGETLETEVFSEDGFLYEEKFCKKDGTKTKIMIEKENKKFPAEREKKDYPYLEFKKGKKKYSLDDLKDWNKCSTIFLTLTQVCNSMCGICFDAMNKNREEMSLDTVRDVVSRVKNKNIYLFGGEPTILKNIDEIIRIVKESGNTPKLYTNGLKLANEDYLKKLISAGLSKVTLSFDGFNEYTYERIRGGRHEYGLKLKAMENLKKHNMPTELVSVVVKDLNEDSIKELIDYAKESKYITEIKFMPLWLPPVRPETKLTEYNVYSKDELFEMAYKATGGMINEEILVEQHKLVFNTAKVLRRFLTGNVGSPARKQFYLFKRNGRIEPIMNVEDLKKINRFLEGMQEKKLRLNELNGLITRKNIRLGKLLVRSLLGADTEIERMKEGIFRVGAYQVITYHDGPRAQDWAKMPYILPGGEVITCASGAE